MYGLIIKRSWISLRGCSAMQATFSTLTRRSTITIIVNRNDELRAWWKEHLAFDQARKARQERVREQEKLRQRGRAKLTPAERKALGIK